MAFEAVRWHLGPFHCCPLHIRPRQALPSQNATRSQPESWENQVSYRNQGWVPLVSGGWSWWLLLSIDPTTTTTIATVQQVLLVVMVIVWWGRWGCCRWCLGSYRWGSRGRWKGCSGGSRRRGLGVFASLPCPLTMLDKAQELQGALSFPVWALSSTTFIASFTAQVVLAADSDSSPEALHNSTVHSWGDWTPSREPRPRGPS